MFANNENKFVYLLALIAFTSMILLNVVSVDNNNRMLVSAEKKTDILFLKGKFILKDKKGAIVISDDHKKPCHCPHYFR